MSLSSHVISNGTLEARIANFGASLVDLRLAGIQNSLVLGYPLIEAYPQDGQFMGAVIGRYANRIARGSAPVDGCSFQLECNEEGVGHLHGGSTGFGVSTWDMVETSVHAVTLRLDSHDGHAGFPGHLTVFATYELIGAATLRLTLRATSTADTIVNLCHHPYFNLDGMPDVGAHKLWIGTDTYLPSHDNLLPIGDIATVEGTPFDFRMVRPLPRHRYNNTYCLHGNQAGPLTHVATLEAGGVRLELSTTQPGLHLYNGYKIKPTARGHSGELYAAFAGICLEAQAWPDSPNHAQFPSVILRRGVLYEQTTDYAFSSICAGSV